MAVVRLLIGSVSRDRRVRRAIRKSPCVRRWRSWSRPSKPLRAGCSAALALKGKVALCVVKYGASPPLKIRESGFSLAELGWERSDVRQLPMYPPPETVLR